MTDLPLRTIFCLCRLGRKERLVARFEWLTLLPETGPFAQMEHLKAIAKICY